MHKFASGESFYAANDLEKRLPAGDMITVLVDQKTGKLDFIASLTHEELRTVNRSGGEHSESAGSTNGHFDPSPSFLSGVVRPGRRKFRPSFVACIAFVVDAETCFSGEVKARELLVVDHELKPANLTVDLYKKISIESMHRHIDSVPHEETCSLQRLHSDSEHSNSRAQSISCTVNAIEHLTCLSKQTTHLDMDAQLAGLLSVTLKISPALFPGFLSYSRHHSRLLLTNQDVPKESFQLSSRSYRHIVVHLTYPEKIICLDYLWFFRLETLLIKCIMLDDLMNWLSTLGGAYSSLGDHFLHHAENAAKISMQQLRIAIEMGSPPLIIRCCLFYSLSLMQRGQLKRSKRIIREQYRATKALPITDERLVMMCKGIWNRLRYLWQKDQNAIQSQKISSVIVQEQSELHVNGI